MQAEPPHKASILLVDDHAPNLVALEAVLGTSNYHLVTASSGAEALELLEKHDFAMVLLDVQMPGMDGYEVSRRIKSSPRTQHIPVILITAVYKEDPQVREGYSAGAIDYFGKPFDPDLLRLKVRIYADLYQKNLALSKREEERRAMERELRALSQTLEERERARKMEEDRRAAELTTILESIPDAIYVGDENGITRCNGPALSMFGFDTCAELNQHFEKLAERIHMRYADTGKPIPPHDQPFSHALRGMQHFCEMKIRHLSSGKDILIACAAAPVRFQGEIIGAVVVNMDVPKVVRRGASPAPELRG